MLEIMQMMKMPMRSKGIPRGEVSVHGDFPSGSGRRKDTPGETKNSQFVVRSREQISAILRGVQEAFCDEYPMAFVRVRRTPPAS